MGPIVGVEGNLGLDLFGEKHVKLLYQAERHTAEDTTGDCSSASIVVVPVPVVRIEQEEEERMKRSGVDQCDVKRLVYRRWIRMRRSPCLVGCEAPLAYPFEKRIAEGDMSNVMWMKKAVRDTERGRSQQGVMPG